jgi:recombinational DNA repair protein (RecF pathway)
MSYAVYTTRGWILGSAPTGEASKMYTLYTEDFGLVHARAQGVRLLSSKLRYNLADYGLCDISLVRGKEFWRLTGASSLPLPEKGKVIRARVLGLVRRLVQGEEKNERLFVALEDLSREDLSETDALCDILAALGYLDLGVVIGKSEREKILLINKALKETQL